MKQALQLRLGQHLTMTPQLQQAIRLLQLSSLELQAEIQEALETNPMLETADEADEEYGEAEAPTGLLDEAERPAQTERAETALDLQAELPHELPVDTAWEDVYENIAAPGGGAGAGTGEEDSGVEYQGTAGESLQDLLRWQMLLTPFSDTDMAIAEAIIDAINEDGYLSASLDEIRGAVGPELQPEFDEIEAVLHRIQNFDPPGVGARDLRESLLLQLKQREPDSLPTRQAVELISAHFDLLVNRDYAQIMRRMKLEEEQLKRLIRLVQSLNPRPGSQVTEAHTEYVVPDVVVRKDKGVWKVELNPAAAPRLRINTHYASLARQAGNNADANYLRNHLQEARWFLKSLQSRNETLLKVASSIVRYQQGFLEHGEEAMKALVLHDIAEEVGMHESTISRVTSRKYMHTPRGIFELKYFFSSHVSTANGGECSATAIRALIKKLVAVENPTKPLSDSKIASLLTGQGINVARRTVAKYREALAIPPSNERKRLA